MDKYRTKFLNSEERDLDDALKKIELKKLKKPTLKEQKQFKKAAKEFIKKETKMNIRIDPFELNKIKKRAQKEGLKYSTFIKSILHKYLTGQLVEKIQKHG